MEPKVPETVSYGTLLTAVKERLATGQLPENFVYFSELVEGLYERAHTIDAAEEHPFEGGAGDEMEVRRELAVSYMSIRSLLGV